MNCVGGNFVFIPSSATNRKKITEELCNAESIIKIKFFKQPEKMLSNCSAAFS